LSGKSAVESGKGLFRASVVALLVAVAVSSVAGAGLVAQSASGAQLDNVQVFVQTANSANYEYYLTVYNATGSLVATTQSSIPGGGFELPAGSYLITASAYEYPYYYCYDCPVYAGQGAATMPSTSYASPQYEYGWAFEQVSGPTTVTINTQNDSSIPTTSVTVKAEYFNGTAASGAYVSSFVVGQYYYYNPGLTMYGQTDSQGMATLTVPQAPVEVDVYESVPVVLPQNETTVTTTIGGQKVNVTVYWSPMYVELTGSALIVPPATSATVTLQYLPQPYCCYYPLSAAPAPYGVVGPPSATGSGTGSSTGQGAPSSGPAARISPLSVSGEQLVGAPGWEAPWVGAAVVLAAAGVFSALFFVLRHRKPTP
jgi:hypothetical protein